MCPKIVVDYHSVGFCPTSWPLLQMSLQTVASFSLNKLSLSHIRTRHRFILKTSYYLVQLVILVKHVLMSYAHWCRDNFVFFFTRKPLPLSKFHGHTTTLYWFHILNTNWCCSPVLAILKLDVSAHAIPYPRIHVMFIIVHVGEFVGQPRALRCWHLVEFSWVPFTVSSLLKICEQL